MQLDRVEHALMRGVPDSFRECISQHAHADRIDVDLARRQHAAYADAMQGLGVRIQILEADERFPDCVFTEDPAIVVGDTVIACNLWQSGSRRGEEHAVLDHLEQGRSVHRVEAPASLEGGDVLQHDGVVYVGRSGRTNQAGIDTIAAACPDVDVVAVPVHDILHLKTAATVAGGAALLARTKHVDVQRLPDLPLIEVPDDEASAANVVNVNGAVLAPAGCPTTVGRLKELGLDVVELDVSEFEKADGSLTCLSIRT